MSTLRVLWIPVVIAAVAISGFAQSSQCRREENAAFLNGVKSANDSAARNYSRELPTKDGRIYINIVVEESETKVALNLLAADLIKQHFSDAFEVWIEPVDSQKLKFERAYGRQLPLSLHIQETKAPSPIPAHSLTVELFAPVWKGFRTESGDSKAQRAEMRELMVSAVISSASAISVGGSREERLSRTREMIFSVLTEAKRKWASAEIRYIPSVLQ